MQSERFCSISHINEQSILDPAPKVTIRAAVRYLLRGTTDGARGDIVQEIISIGYEES